MERYYPISDAIDAGAIATIGSDRIMPEAIDVWNLIETIVTREVIGGGEESVAPGQRISLRQAISALTESAARLTGMRHRIGTIEPGMQADMIIVDRNPFEIPATSIHDVSVKSTYIDGELVYEAK